MTPDRPTPEIAAAIAQHALGWPSAAATRFQTGSGHYVYEAHGDGRSVVVRMGLEAQRAEMTAGLHLAETLATMAVPLPAIYATGLDDPLPWVVMERLAGTDLGAVIAGLSNSQLSAIATRVAQAQAVAARFGSAGRYGYSATAEAAPHGRWSAVVRASMDRSHRGIKQASLFDLGVMDAVTSLYAAHLPALDAIAATPFLHDTTTKNVIIAADGTFSGIVDVDDLCFGDPRYAPALTKAVLLAYGGPLHYVDAWMRAAGHDDDAVFRFYVALFLVDLMAEHGHVSNGNERPSTPEQRQGLLVAFDQAIAADR